MSGKKVQVGRSRMAEEMARPTWEAPSAPVSIHKKKETAPKQPRQKVETISSAPITQRKLRVAAYARVSTDLDSQETSIENQCDHYKSLTEERKKATSSILRKLPRYAGFFMRWLTARAPWSSQGN